MCSNLKFFIKCKHSTLFNIFIKITIKQRREFKHRINYIETTHTFFNYNIKLFVKCGMSLVTRWLFTKNPATTLFHITVWRSSTDNLNYINLFWSLLRALEIWLFVSIKSVSPTEGPQVGHTDTHASYGRQVVTAKYGIWHSTLRTTSTTHPQRTSGTWPSEIRWNQQLVTITRKLCIYFIQCL